MIADHGIIAPSASTASGGASSIYCQSVTLTFPGDVRVLDDVNLDVAAGQFLSLIGPSGCGKTTLLRVIAGLQPVSSGSMELKPTGERRRGGIAFVFQQPALLPWRTALQNVVLPLELAGLGSRGSRRDAAVELLETVGLSDAMSRYPDQLSGGMRMRVSIARALVTSPRVLLLDEPFAALDDMLRNQLGELLRQLWQQRQFTAVLVTHNIAEAVLLSDRLVVMRAGKLSAPIDNPLEPDRDEGVRRTARFADFYGQVSDVLRGLAC